MNSETLNTQTEEILSIFYKNIFEKNSAGVIATLTDDIDWYIVKSEELPWSGRHIGKSDIRNALELLFNAHVDGADHLRPDHNFVDGAEAAVFGSITRQVKATGKSFTAGFCQRFTIRDGLISRFLMLEDTPEILKAF